MAEGLGVRATSTCDRDVFQSFSKVVFFLSDVVESSPLFSICCMSFLHLTVIVRFSLCAFEYEVLHPQVKKYPKCLEYDSISGKYKHTQAPATAVPSHRPVGACVAAS